LQTPEVFLRTPFNERSPQISRDGKWIAYVSDESGIEEIYVRPLSGSGGQVKVSANGGARAIWSPDGKELIYHDDSLRKLMAVRFADEGGEFRPDLAREILDYPRTYGFGFDIEPGAMRILTDEDVLPEGASVRQPTVVVNWFDQLEQRTLGQ
jgi:hypothetical protein